MPPLRLHGVVIPNVSEKQPEKTPGKPSQPDAPSEPVKTPTRTSSLPKFRQLSIDSPERRLPSVDSAPSDNNMNVKMRTITIAGVPSTGGTTVPVVPVAPKEKTDSDVSVDERPKISPIRSETQLLNRPTALPVKLKVSRISPTCANAFH
jgi:hypothetical protein